MSLSSAVLQALYECSARATTAVNTTRTRASGRLVGGSMRELTSAAAELPDLRSGAYWRDGLTIRRASLIDVGGSITIFGQTMASIRDSLMPSMMTAATPGASSWGLLGQIIVGMDMEILIEATAIDDAGRSFFAPSWLAQTMWVSNLGLPVSGVQVAAGVAAVTAHQGTYQVYTTQALRSIAWRGLGAIARPLDKPTLGLVPTTNGLTSMNSFIAANRAAAAPLATQPAVTTALEWEYRRITTI